MEYADAGMPQLIEDDDNDDSPVSQLASPTPSPPQQSVFHELSAVFSSMRVMGEDASLEGAFVEHGRAVGTGSASEVDKLVFMFGKHVDERRNAIRNVCDTAYIEALKDFKDDRLERFVADSAYFATKLTEALQSFQDAEHKLKQTLAEVDKLQRWTEQAREFDCMENDAKDLSAVLDRAVARFLTDKELTAKIQEVDVAHGRFLSIAKGLGVTREALGWQGKTCCICLEGVPDHACVPCGHCCCESCSLQQETGRRATSTCFVCRAPVQQRIKLFFA